MRLGYGAITWGGVVGTPGGVTSVKDLFYMTYGDTERALREIAAAGYTGIELFDGDLLKYQANSDVLQGWLRETQLELVSVYSGANFIYPDIADDEFAKIEAAASLSAEFGARRLVLGGGAKRSAGPARNDLAALAEGLDRAAAIAADHGLDASYHPHLGTLVEEPDALARLMDISSIQLCPDTAHLAAGGADPAEVIRTYASRIAHVHLKDLTAGTTDFMPLGLGDLDFDDILVALQESGYDSWLMVELDNYDGDPAEAAGISKAFLDEHLSDRRSS